MKRRQFSTMLALIMLFFPVHGLAIEVLSANISAKEWTWDPGSIAVFEGTVVYEGSAEEEPLTLVLSMESTPSASDNGSIVFASINDQKLSRMKQKSQYMIQKENNKVLRFTGNWILPDESILTNVRIMISVFGPDGSKLSEAAFTEYDKTGNGEIIASYRFPDLVKWMRISLVCAAMIWLAATIRIMYYHKHRGD